MKLELIQVLTLWAQCASVFATLFASLVALYLGLRSSKPKVRFTCNFGYLSEHQGQQYYIANPTEEMIEQSIPVIQCKIYNIGAPNISIDAVGIMILLSNNAFFIPPNFTIDSYILKKIETGDSLSFCIPIDIIIKSKHICSSYKKTIFKRFRYRVQIDMSNGRFVRAKIPQRVYSYLDSADN